MHHLITAVGSIMILMLFISQFAANEKVFLETLAVEREINAFLANEYEEPELPDRIRELEKNINDIPNVSAVIRGTRLSVTLENVIGPSSAVTGKDNSIIIEKDLELRIKEENDEESIDNDGDPPSDGPS